MSIVGDHLRDDCMRGMYDKPLSDRDIRNLACGFFDVDGQTIHARSDNTNITEKLRGFARAVEATVRGRL